MMSKYIKIDENTTFFISKKDLDFYNIEIADNSNRIKIADMSVEKITPIRYHVRKVRIY